MKKRIVSLLLAVFMFIAFVPLQADSAKGLAEGGSDDAAAGDACGENLFWSLENGVLTIRGSGGAFSFTTAAGAPWHDRVSEITGFVVEQGVTIVPAEACFGCTNLSSISIANSVTAIGTDAFGRCTSLRSVSIPDSVNVLGMYAFFGCENLTTATLGIGVNGLGYTVFGNTPSLTQINVASRNTYITSINGVVYNKDKSRLLYRPEANGESLTVPASVLGIAEGTCMYSFSGTASQSLLKEIRFEGDAPGFGTNCFKGITANAYYPENNDTWTAAKRESCSGNLTWIPYEAESVKINIAACDISLSFESAQWTGSPIRPTVTVTDKGAVLKEYTHYEMEYADNLKVGTASVTVTGKGFYTGSVTKTFTIAKADQTLELSMSFTDMEIGDRTQLRAFGTRGAAYLTYVSDKPEVASIDSNSYVTALSVGTAVITVTSAGNENYNEVSETITITVKEKEPGPYDINTCNIRMATGNMSYTGYNRKAVFTIYRKSKLLVENRDYIIECQNCVDVGTATAVIIGKGDFFGSVSYTYQILKAGQNISASISPKSILLGETAQITAEGIGAFSYTSNDTDIAVVDENGVVTGVGVGTVYIDTVAAGDKNHNAAGLSLALEVSAPVVPGLISIADCDCSLNTLLYTYDGTAKKPTATVIYEDKTLEEGKDYRILYDKNVNAGYAKAVIVGSNDYTGSSEPLTYTIERADQVVRIDQSSPLIIKVGESATITASAIGKLNFHTATANNVLNIGWESGIVTGLNPGSVEVYVSAGGGGNYNPGISTISVQVVSNDEPVQPVEADNIYVLPRELSVIGEEAFAGNIQLQGVHAAEGSDLSEIRGGAFRNCVNLIEVELPESVYSIASDAFEGCSNLFLIVSNDYCAEFAEAHGIPYIRNQQR